MNTGVPTSKKRKNSPELSIILPIYNEEGSIVSLLREYQKSWKKYNFELVCVNNGSTDLSGKVLHEFSNKKEYQFIKIVTVKKNIGYGHGIMSGINKASGEVISWTHADMQTHPADVFRAFDIYSKFKSPNIIVKGTRSGRPLVDSLISFLMGIIASVVLNKKMHEINAQPKLFHKSFRQYLLHPPDDFMLDMYLLYTAKQLNFQIKEIPVIFHKRKQGRSKWAFSFSSRLKMIKRTFQYMFEILKS